MASRFPLRFTDDSFPETLQGALVLLYIGAVVDVLTGGLNSAGATLLIVGRVAAALAMAQSRRWGYSLAIGVAVAFIVPYVLSFAYYQEIGNGGSVLSLFFDVLLLAMLLHPRSRAHQRLWFR